MSSSSISSWLSHATSELRKAGIDSASLDSRVLLEFALLEPRSWILAHGEEMLSKNTLEKLNNFLKQRTSHTPIAYIIGSKEFYGRDFIVNEDVLIPRPESETIIDLVIESYKDISTELQSQHIIILDIGTGSACLSITAKLEIPTSLVVAVDISNKALVTAKKNAQKHGVDIVFKYSDLFSNIREQKSDIIIANLPYVPNNLITSKEITKEPMLALFSGDDGMEHYSKFWKQLSEQAHPTDIIVTECLYEQQKEMETLASTQGFTMRKCNDLIQVFKRA